MCQVKFDMQKNLENVVKKVDICWILSMKKCDTSGKSSTTPKQQALATHHSGMATTIHTRTFTLKGNTYNLTVWLHWLDKGDWIILREQRK